MTCEVCRAAIAERLDGSLDAAGEAALQGHLEACADCAALARDLDQIKRNAPMLERLQPPPVVWARVKAGIDTAQADRTRSAQWRRSLALAAALILTTGLGVFYLTRADPRTTAPGTSAPAPTEASADTGRTEGAATLVQSIEEELRLAAQHYERAIAGLEAATADQKTLDPQLAVTLQKNLGVIDQAIEESRAALRAQPSSQPARESLFEAFKNKVILLQDTIALINEMRKGDDAGTARVMSELTK